MAQGSATEASGDGHVPRPLPRGLLPPIPTPFVGGRLDLMSLEAMLEYLGDSVDGVLLGGSVGEVSSLTVQERVTLMNKLADYRASGKRLAVSIADNSIENVRVLSEAAMLARADLLMLSCPGYFDNSIEMLEGFFGAVSELTPIDICLYDNPAASNTALSVDDVIRLIHAAPSLTAIKVTDTALGKVAELRQRTDLLVFSGDDTVLWHQLREGADGAMVALPTIFPEQTAELWRALQTGEVSRGFETYISMAPFIQIALGAHDYPAVIKAVLKDRGILGSAEVRLPLARLGEPRRRLALEAARASVSVGGKAHGD